MEIVAQGNAKANAWAAPSLGGLYLHAPFSQDQETTDGQIPNEQEAMHRDDYRNRKRSTIGSLVRTKLSFAQTPFPTENPIGDSPSPPLQQFKHNDKERHSTLLGKSHGSSLENVRTPFDTRGIPSTTAGLSTAIRKYAQRFEDEGRDDHTRNNASNDENDDHSNRDATNTNGVTQTHKPGENSDKHWHVITSLDDMDKRLKQNFPSPSTQVLSSTVEHDVITNTSAVQNGVQSTLSPFKPFGLFVFILSRPSISNEGIRNAVENHKHDKGREQDDEQKNEHNEHDDIEGDAMDAKEEDKEDGKQNDNGKQNDKENNTDKQRHDEEEHHDNATHSFNAIAVNTLMDEDLSLSPTNNDHLDIDANGHDYDVYGGVDHQSAEEQEQEQEQKLEQEHEDEEGVSRRISAEPLKKTHTQTKETSNGPAKVGNSNKASDVSTLRRTSLASNSLELNIIEDANQVSASKNKPVREHRNSNGVSNAMSNLLSKYNNVPSNANEERNRLPQVKYRFALPIHFFSNCFFFLKKKKKKEQTTELIDDGFESPEPRPLTRKRRQHGAQDENKKANAKEKTKGNKQKKGKTGKKKKNRLKKSL
ncbi:sec-1 family protein [Reticulomyxa filosa]|uniref:Sec-1 family protein n=1 Tax=Reticulomyxa filosa TaxID=46433 RepID=X6NPR5_RETFI|nr:sec-1 family protein [Reticulomyxa filosa]|eukprot:ETO27699.1 sec-1 family protein [Reticulomyxa filosa]